MAKSYTYTINLRVNASNGKLKTADERMKSLRNSIRSLNTAMRRFSSILSTTTGQLSSFNSQMSSAARNSDKLARNMNTYAKTSKQAGRRVYNDSADRREIKNQEKKIRNNDQIVSQMGMERRSRYYGNVADVSMARADRTRGYTADYSRQQKSGRAISRLKEKGDRFADIGMMMGGYMGFSSLKNYLYDTPVRAETNKWLMGTMGDQTASKDVLYKTLDTTTDKLPISMQSVAQPLYAFKAASGATADTINSIIPQFANFGAVVQNMTGSTELAETAMMKLGYGLKGRYAALDQYGITEDALKRAGWSGDEKDIQGYMAAVTKIVGDAGESMNTFAGKTQVLNKALSRAGKNIWDSGLGSALSQVVGGITDLLNAGNGWGGKIALISGTTLTGAMTLISAVGYAQQAMASMKEALAVGASNMSHNFRKKVAWLGRSMVFDDAIDKAAAFKDRKKNFQYHHGIFDYSNKDLKEAGVDARTRKRMSKQKSRVNDFVSRFGYGKLAEAQMGEVSLTDPNRRAKIKAIQKSAKNDINDMGFRQKFGIARKSAFKGVGKAFMDGGGSSRLGDFLGLQKLGKLNTSGGFKALGGGISNLAGGFTSMLTVLNPLTVAVGGLAVGLSVLAGIFAVAYTSSEQFRQHVGQVGEKLKQLGANIINLVGDVFKGMGFAQEGGLNGVIEVAERILGAVEKIIDILNSTIDALRGTDAERERMDNQDYKTFKAAEDRLREADRQGKPRDPKDQQTYDWWYGTPENNHHGREWYLRSTEEGTYFDEQRKKTNEQYGTNFQPGMSWEDFLANRRELAWGSLGVDGVGKKKEDVETTQRLSDQTGTSTQDMYKYESIGQGLVGFASLLGNIPKFGFDFGYNAAGGTPYQDIIGDSLAGFKKEMTNANPNPDLNQLSMNTGSFVGLGNFLEQNTPKNGTDNKDIANPINQLIDAITKIDTSKLGNDDGTTQQGQSQGQGQGQGLQMASNIPQLAMSVGGSLQTMATDAWNIINGTNQTGLMQMSTDITTGAGLAYGQIPLQLQNQAPGVQMAGTNLGLSGNTGLSIGMSGMAQTAATKSNEAGNAVSSGSGAANSGGATLGNSANSGADGALDLVSIFKNEVGHIKDVILQGIPDVVSAVTSMVGAANDAAYKKEDQNSPGIISRMFGAEMGFTAMLIKKGTPDITKSIFEMVAGANKTFERNVNTLQFPVDNSQITSYIPNYNNAPMTNALNEELIHSSVRGTPSVTRSDANPNTNNNNNNQTVNMTFNIERVDSEERVHEIKDVIYETLFFNNETHGRQEPTPII